MGKLIYGRELKVGDLFYRMDHQCGDRITGFEDHPGLNGDPARVAVVGGEYGRAYKITVFDDCTFKDNGSGVLIPAHW